MLRAVGDDTLRRVATPEEIALWKDVLNGANPINGGVMSPEGLTIKESEGKRPALQLEWSGNCPHNGAVGIHYHPYYARTLAAYLQFGEVLSYDLLSKEIDGSTSGRALYGITTSSCGIGNCLPRMTNLASLECKLSLSDRRSVDGRRMLEVALELASRHIILDTIFRATRMMQNNLKSETPPQPDLSVLSTALDRTSNARMQLGVLLAHLVSVDPGVLKMLNTNPSSDRAKQMLELVLHYDLALKDALTLTLSDKDMDKIVYRKDAYFGSSVTSSRLIAGAVTFKGSNQVL